MTADARVRHVVTHAERDPVAVAESRRARGEITRQRAHQIRKREGAPPARMGAPPKPALELARNAAGNVVLHVVLPDRALDAMDGLARRAVRGFAGTATNALLATLGAHIVRGRKGVATLAFPQGFAAMRKRPPARHVAPAGERQGTTPSGVRVEVAPTLLAEVDAYAAEYGTARAIVVAMAVVRGVEMMKKEGGR